MSMNILNDISAVYLNQIAEKKDDSYLETDMKKRQENNEKAREEMKKTKANKDMVKAARKSMGIEDDDDEDDINEATYSAKAARAGKDIGKPGKAFAKIAKSAAERYGSEERGKKVAGAVLAKLRKEEIEIEESKEKDPFGRPGGKYGGVPKKGGGYDRGYQAMQKKLKELEKEKTRTEALDPVGKEDSDIDNDGDTDSSDKYLHKRRKAIGKAIAKKNVKEGFSNWRQDLSEVMDDIEANKQIKEKKVNNKIKINPEMKEAVEQLGGELVEMVELDEKTLTSAETKKKEEIVKSMKKKSGDFEKRYPGRGKEVMYATATKMAKKVAEETSDSEIVIEKDEKIEAKFKGARTPFLLDKFRKEHPGSRQEKKERGAKETPKERQSRLTNRQVERAVKYGLTKKEKGETQAREKYYSSRD